MNPRIFVKIAIFWIGSVMLLACEEYDDPLWNYDDDLSSRATVLGTYQAENHTFQSGCKLMKNNRGYTGTGFMDYGGKGTLVEWNNVNVPSAGEYTLRFRYANGSRGDRRSTVTVNSSSIGSVAFAPTGSWTTWKTASIKARLKAGKNKIRVTADPGSGPNLDKMDTIAEGNGGTGNRRCVEVAENKNASLSCPGGGVIETIEFASYGVPKGSCSAGFTRGSCHAASSSSKVTGSCLNRKSCAVGANNRTFGDPCAGTFKKLAVIYKCSEGGTPGVSARDFVGDYERTPILNNWHNVNITFENNRLSWKNAAGARWSLSYAGGVLKSGSDCPYGQQVIGVQKQSGSDPIKSLKFNGETYYKRGDDDEGYAGSGKLLSVTQGVLSSCDIDEQNALKASGYTRVYYGSIGKWTKIFTIQGSPKISQALVNEVGKEVKRAMQPIVERYPDRLRKVLDKQGGTMNFILLYGKGGGWGAWYDGSGIIYAKRASARDLDIFHEIGHHFDISNPSPFPFRSHKNSILSADDANTIDRYCSYTKPDGTCAFSEFIAENYGKMFYPKSRETVKNELPVVYQRLLKYVPTPSSYVPFQNTP